VVLLATYNLRPGPGASVNIPAKREMLKVAELEMERLPFLYYGTKKELAEQKIKPVVI